MTVRYSRVPDNPDRPSSETQFLDGLDKRHIAVGQLTDAESTATNAELAAKINELLAIFRTR